MTGTQAVEAILTDLTDDNQSQLLPILADALADVGFHNEEQAIRWALINNKRPFEYHSRAFRTTYTWRRSSTTDDLQMVSNSGRLPDAFQGHLRHSDKEEKSVYHGRYYTSVEDAWRAFMELSVTHLHLLTEVSNDD